MKETTKSYIWILTVYYAGVMVGLVLAYAWFELGILGYLFDWW